MGASVLPSPEVSLAMGTGLRTRRTGRLPPREEIARHDDGVPSARPDDGVASGLELSPLPSSARYRALPATELCEAVGPGADTNYFAELGRGAGCFAELETGAGYFAERGRGAGVRSSSACCQKASSSREAVRNTVTSSSKRCSVRERVPRMSRRSVARRAAS